MVYDNAIREVLIMSYGRSVEGVIAVSWEDQKEMH